MNKPNNTLIVCAVLATALTGCGVARDNIHRDDYLASHDMPVGVAERIASERVSLGMSKAEVRAAWGKPIVISDTGKGELWNYGPGVIANAANLPGRKFAEFDESGRVIAWEQPR